MSSASDFIVLMNKIKYPRPKPRIYKEAGRWCAEFPADVPYSYRADAVHFCKMRNRKEGNL